MGSGRRYVAVALLGDGHAAWHLATSAAAVDRGLVMRSSGAIHFSDTGAQYHSLELRNSRESGAET